MKRHQFAAALFLLASVPALAARQIVIVEGLGGEDRYAQAFADQVARIEAASRPLAAAGDLYVLRAADSGVGDVETLLSTLAASATGDDELLVYLVGHGTYDDHEYRFNLPGPDLTGDALHGLLEAHPARAQLVVATGSASGALEDLLAGSERMLVLATRSGRERHATTFGTFFAIALSDEAADVDKNGTVTAAEAFRFAEREVADHYERNGQLATEHPQLSGELAERFALARLAAEDSPGGDRQLAALLRERQRLNGEVEALRLARGNLPAEEYQARLLEKMLALAKLEDRIEARQEAGKP